MKVEFHLDKQRSPTSEKGMKVTYGQAKRGGYRLRWYLLLAIVLSPLLTMAYFFTKDAVYITAPGIITAMPVTLSAPFDAVVDDIDVKNGQNVTKQQLLVSLWDPVVAKDIESLQQQVIDIDETLRNQSGDSLALYDASIADAQKNLTEMEGVMQRYREFSRQGQVSQIDLASAFQMYSAAQLSVDNNRIAQQKAKEDALQQRLAVPVAQARREMLLKLGTLHAQQEEMSIESPYPGSITDVLVQVGQRLAQGDPLVVVSPNRPPKIIAYLSAKFIDRAQLGYSATVIFPDGSKRDATVSEPTKMASKLPPQLAKPFEGSPALLRVVLAFDAPISADQWVEGMPIEVHF